MFPWGAIIGLAGQAVSGALSITNNRRMQQEADAEAARRKAFYEAKANENPLSRSEVQHVLGQYDRSAQQQIENARSMAAIKGATPEFAAAVQKGVAEGRANLMGQVAAGASQRADYYNMLGEQAQHQKAQEDMQRRMQRNSTYAALAGNAASAVGAIMDGYSAKMPKANVPSTNKTTAQINAQMQNLNTVTDNTAPKSARLEAASQLAGGTKTPEGVVLHDTANASANAQKLATAAAQPPKPAVEPLPQTAPYDYEEEQRRRNLGFML